MKAPRSGCSARALNPVLALISFGDLPIKLSKDRFAYISRVKKHDVLPTLKPLTANTAICCPNGFLTTEENILAGGDPILRRE